jgi:hypothetical protein
LSDLLPCGELSVPAMTQKRPTGARKSLFAFPIAAGPFRAPRAAAACASQRAKATYLDDTGVLDALTQSVVATFVHEDLDKRTRELLRCGKHSEALLSAIERIRSTISTLVEAGRICFSARQRYGENTEGETDTILDSAPTLDLMSDHSGFDAAIVDDRCLNKLPTLTDSSGRNTILGAAIDVLAALKAAGEIDEEVHWRARHQLRIAGYGDVPASLHDRAADNWWALLAVADAAGGHWPQTARQAAVALSSGGEDAESAAVLLLHDMHALFERRGARIPTQAILDVLHAMDDRPWPEWRQGKPITAQQLARLLKPFGIASTTIRMDSGQTPKGFKRESFIDAFSRYLPDLAATPPQVLENCEKHDNESRHMAAGYGTDVAGNNSEKSQNPAGCGGMAAQQGEKGAEGVTQEE